MDLNAIRTFIEVVRAGGFSAAARRLGMPRSTVSLRVRTLEDNLGVRLFKRSTRAVALTEEGRALFTAADTSLGALDETVTSIGAVGGELKGPIRVTATGRLSHRLPGGGDRKLPGPASPRHLRGHPQQHAARPRI
jgi:DNA-binding transcriptional LysR family regulator